VQPLTLSIGGITPLTSTDYPGHLAAVVFCQGCSWRCGYCHNPHLISRQSETLVSWAGIKQFLERRRGLLDAVVFSGGEPTLQRGLRDAVKETRDLGYKVALHTGGPYPSRLHKLLPLLDWVGMDIKADFENYDATTGAPGSGTKAMESAQMLIASGIDCEFRTTVHPSLILKEQLLFLAKTLSGIGAKNYVLQEFRPTGCTDAKLAAVNATGYLDEELCDEIRPMFETFEVRRG
jgi:anaerobic ribonucleoside-triphosphate reductase activating protein